MREFFTFDTETKEGKAFLITASTENKDLVRELNGIDDIIKTFNWFLKFRCGFAFNLSYDTWALLKWFVTKGDLGEIYFKNQIVWEGFIIKVLPNKLLEISKGRKKVCIYDIYQFYACSLDKAAEKHLGEKKVQIGEENRANYYEYYINNKQIAIEYAIKDSRLTYRLSELFLQRLENAGVTCYKYFSAGYIAFKHLKHKYNITPQQITDKEIQEFVKRAYFGGRIEFKKRGTIKKAHVYDINSAYPSAIRELKQIEYIKFDKDIWEDSDYFFIELSFNLKSDKISPLAFRTNTGMVIYPEGKIENVVLDHITYNNVLKYATDIKIHKVLNIICTDKYIFKECIDDLYKERKKNEGNNYIFKLILNSLYGKMAMGKKSMIEIDDPIISYENLSEKFNAEIKNNCDDCFKLGFVSDKCRKPCCKKYRKEVKTITQEQCFYIDGAFYKWKKELDKKSNIIYAALITSKIRNLMFEVSEEIGHENTIGFMTDAIFTSKKIPKKYISEKLGYFSIKEENTSLYVLGTGIYQTDKESHTRGFRTKEKLIDLAIKNEKSNIIPVLSNSRTGEGEVLQRGANIDTLNIITEVKKEIKLNLDKKRVWEKNFRNFEESLKNNINSKTIKL